MRGAVSRFSPVIWKRHSAWVLAAFLLLGLAAPASAQQTVFVTRGTLQGDLQFDPLTTGLDGADALCNQEAATAGLPDAGQFKAWLSTINTGVNAKDRIPQANGPYVLPDFGATVIANTTLGLLSGTLLAPIQVFADGAPASSSLNVWTGTMADGTPSVATCLDWTTTVTTDPFVNGGITGNSTMTGVGWTTRFPPFFCDSERHLYCFGPPAPTIEVTKVLVPASDPGRFDVLIGATTTTLGHNESTGVLSVTPGPLGLSETAAAGTNLADYISSIACSTVIPSQGPPPVVSCTNCTTIALDLASGSETHCTITNQRIPPVPAAGPAQLVMLLFALGLAKLWTLGRRSAMT